MGVVATTTMRATMGNNFFGFEAGVGFGWERGMGRGGRW